MIDKRKAQLVKSITEAYNGAEQAERDTVTLLKYMDFHLSALSKAQRAKDESQLAFHTHKLKQVRQQLMQLEYFSLPEEP
ncbi:hypothetical protein EalM132_00191 [Exiguobacterium phage vB_EalM-132]|nr:hypothetical protein EalM132_00021 [Exiguobacterium phage vB_EalM-132]AYP68703.1 hypothetical protein EalM132_00191 [Exiguobacterium phage vB_EalM-132]